ncbi:type IV secretion system DNA-binding domain-containing protein [Candidatus Gottesmanbacteria bacterium]|nr:type IV secretion system DNA-binding domain-containing protein [Candidatus Gottesmanbacteria bacterium]
MSDEIIAEIIFRLQAFVVAFLLMVALAGSLFLVGYLMLLWWQHHRREQTSLESSLLQVAVPRDNEIKIDAMEQFFASLASIKTSAWLPFLTMQDRLTFEIVATPGDIHFYVSVPKHLRDMVEKQIHGTYPGAEIKEVDEYNIFSSNGKVAYAALKTKSANYQPLKAYKDLPVDPLSPITSALAKMQEGEGAVIQILVAPADDVWKKEGRHFVSTTKKQEADPEKAKYSVDPKTLEAITNKCNKPGFATVIRVVVSSTDAQSAKMHLTNIKSAFAQFTSEHNGFSSVKVFLKAKPIHISRDDRRRHMYIIGKTGTGKSEFLKDMILQDIKAGEGVAVIDPHGDLVEKILLLMPPERAEDVIYFDPADTERPMGLNMLEAHTEEQKHFISTAIIGLMYKL